MKASTKMQKGFTLIELMVVIVIIGILSAVALPKMFGLSAKAKASEIAPTAATYERLQQAYVAEVSSLGSLSDIGFKSPASKFFSYAVTDDVNGTEASKKLEIYLKANLSSDCTTTDAGTGNGWYTEVDAASAAVRLDASEADCAQLTPSFEF